MGLCCSCCRKSNYTLAKKAYEQYLQSRNRDDLVKALALFPNALEECRASSDEERLTFILIKYAEALYVRYNSFSDSAEDLAKVIELEEEAFKRLEANVRADDIATEYEVLLQNLGGAYLSQYQVFDDQAFFEKAMDKFSALRLRHTASVTRRMKSALSMADALIEWSENTDHGLEARKEKVETAIDVLETARGHLGDERAQAQGVGVDPQELKSFQEQCAVNLAMAYHSRFKIEKGSGSGNVENGIPDLERAIACNKQAREMLLGDQGLGLVYCLFNLARQLVDKYEWYLDRPGGQEEDLDEVLEEAKRVAKEGIEVIDGRLSKTTDSISQEIKQWEDTKKDLEQFLKTFTRLDTDAR